MWKRGNLSRSRSRTVRPRRARAVAADEPPGPPPITATSKSHADAMLGAATRIRTVSEAWQRRHDGTPDVEHDGLTGEKARAVGDDPRHAVGDVLHGTEAAHRRGGDQLRHRRLVAAPQSALDVEAGGVGGDEARVDAVDGDAVRPELARE